MNLILPGLPRLNGRFVFSVSAQEALLPAVGSPLIQHCFALAQALVPARTPLMVIHHILRNWWHGPCTHRHASTKQLVSPLKMGDIFQTVMAPERWNCPRHSSMKKRGIAPHNSIKKYGMRNAPAGQKAFYEFSSLFSTVPEGLVSLTCDKTDPCAPIFQLVHCFRFV